MDYRSLNERGWLHAGMLFGIVGLLHAIAWSLFFFYAPRFPTMAGLGALAYGLGLRHAFDADHISAIDDTTRFLLQKGRRPLAVGFSFSLGHSTIVLLMTIALAFAAKTVRTMMPSLESYGAIIGASVSGIFLWLIGILNLLVLVGIVRIWRQMKAGTYSHENLEELLARRGLTRRVLGGRLQNLISHSWQMYPVGMLFGLGFDTASEIALLAIAAGAASQAVPTLAVISLALLFASGMSLMDTADGIFMVKAYGWAFSSPLRKIYYNLSTTSLSVVIALLIGSVELLQVMATELKLHGRVIDALGALDFESLGYLIVALFVLWWAGSVGLWKLRGMDAG
ncbi:MAG TPA: HoxN/HupN/NixA family nickel/cobalt transporter [Candidatus Binataceae bacterium]|nr:HoxN/HupN/NixA family nickel/cobalt transporter [Candidatus Binataceae bacterium]